MAFYSRLTCKLLDALVLTPLELFCINELSRKLMLMHTLVLNKSLPLRFPQADGVIIHLSILTKSVYSDDCQNITHSINQEYVHLFL